MARFEERSRHVQINDESICDSCRSRLGTKLFAMYPDDSVVCYKVCKVQKSAKNKQADEMILAIVMQLYAYNELLRIRVHQID